MSLIVACGNGGNATTTTGDTATTVAETTAATTAPSTDTTVASDEPITIRMWLAREQFAPVESFYAKLAELSPNITLETEIIPDDDLFFQLIRMSEANDPMPDIVQLDDYYSQPFALAGLAVPLDDYVAQWEADDPDSFGAQPDIVFMRDEAGSIIGISPIGFFDVLYYRTDILEAAGVELPFTSWEGVLAAARAVKASNQDIVPWSMQGARGSGANALLSQMASVGVPFEGAIPQLDTDQGRYIIGWLQTLSREGLISEEVLAWTEDESRGAFLGGNAAMTFDSMRSSNDFGEALAEIDLNFPDQWALQAIPTKINADDAEGGEVIIGRRPSHVTVDSTHPDEAFDIIKLLMTPDIALDMLAGGGVVPLQEGVLKSDVFQEAYPFVTDTEVDAIVTAGPRPGGETFFQVVEILEQMTQDAISNPDEAVEAIAERWQAELDELAG